MYSPCPVADWRGGWRSLELEWDDSRGWLDLLFRGVGLESCKSDTKAVLVLGALRFEGCLGSTRGSMVGGVSLGPETALSPLVTVGSGEEL